MSPHVLDNPVWNALASQQRHLGLGGAWAKRYLSEVAPFIAIAEESPEAYAAMASLATAGEVVALIGSHGSLPAEWELERQCSVLQMVWTRRIEAPPKPMKHSVLGPSDVPDMLDLISIAFPGFFRARTIEMGTYVGIRYDGRLVAMAGERLFLDGYRELSGICTHPDHRGRGYAQHLIALLVDGMLKQGLTPFLHVDSDNEGAKRIYEKMGFTGRRDLPYCWMKRAQK